VSKLLSLIIFEVDDFPVAVAAESVSSFIPLEDYKGNVPSTGLPDFFIGSGISLKADSFVMVVNNDDGTNTCYLTPSPRELVEYPMNELYPLPELVEKVSPESNASGYCLHRGRITPILQPKTGCN